MGKIFDFWIEETADRIFNIISFPFLCVVLLGLAVFVWFILEFEKANKGE